MLFIFVYNKLVIVNAGFHIVLVTKRIRDKALFIIYYLLFIIYHLSFIIYHLSFIIYYLLFIIYYLLFIFYFLLFIIITRTSDLKVK